MLPSYQSSDTVLFVMMGCLGQQFYIVTCEFLQGSWVNVIEYCRLAFI